MRTSRTIGRVAALAAVVVGVVAVVVLFGIGDDDYTYKARFINASQLVKGDQIEIGGTAVGSINSIDLTSDGRAEITFSLQHKHGPLRHGTKAIVRQASLSGVANRSPGQPQGTPQVDEPADYSK